MPVKYRALAINSSFNVTVVRMTSSIQTWGLILKSNVAKIDADLVTHVSACWLVTTDVWVPGGGNYLSFLKRCIFTNL